MPSPRSGSLRAVPPVQFDASTRDEAAYTARRRRGDSGPFTGTAVAVRNGLPARPYPVPGLVFPGCGCIYRASGQHLTACQDHQSPQVPYLGSKRRYTRA